MGTADTCVLGDQPTFCPGWKATCWRPEVPGALRTSLGCSWQDASLEATKGWGAAPSSSSAWGSEGGAAPGGPNTRAPRRDRLPRRRDRTLAMLLPFLGRQRRHRVLYQVSGESGRCPPHNQSPWVSMKNDESFLSNFTTVFLLQKLNTCYEEDIENILISRKTNHSRRDFPEKHPFPGQCSRLSSTQWFTYLHF